MNNELLEAGKQGNVEEMRRLLDSGADANTADELGRTVLMIVAGKRNGTEVVRLLLSHHADVNAVTKRYGFTALIFAIRSAQWNTARLLIKNGADADAAEGDAIIGVITDATFNEDQKMDMLHLLLQHGARHSPVDANGRAALWWADHYFGYNKIAALLRAAGAT